MAGKQDKEGWRDEKGAVRTLQRAWHKFEHEAAIRHFRAAAAVYGLTRAC